MRRIRNSLAPFVAFAVVLTLAQIAFALPGDPDTTFSGDGVVHTNVSSDVGGLDTAFGLAIQADGRIVATGRSAGRFALIRYDTNGTLDGTFGGDGRVVTNVTPQVDVAFDVAVQPDGGIVAVGRAGGSGGGFAVVRYDAAGMPDATFGGDGVVVTHFSSPDASASGIAIQTDGKIVVTGRTGSAFVVVRYLANGTLDPEFTSDGIVRTDLTDARDIAAAVTIQADGKIVVAGTAQKGSGANSDSKFAVVRYDADGTLDFTFGRGGKVIDEISSFDDIVYDAAVKSEGQILVAGTTLVGGFDLDTYSAVIQLDVVGTLDPSFSDDGVRTLNVTNRPDVATGLAIQTDGKILVSGVSMGVGPCCPSKAWLLRYRTNGKPDHTFNDGDVVTDPADALVAHDVAVQADGNILIAGRAGVDASRFAVLRYLGA